MVLSALCQFQEKLLRLPYFKSESKVFNNEKCLMQSHHDGEIWGLDILENGEVFLLFKKFYSNS